MALENNKVQKKGRVLVVAFQDGIPASGVAVRTLSGLFTTNSEGVLSLDLPAVTQKILVVSTDQEFSVNVVEDEEVQVTLHLLKGKESTADVNEPEKPVDKVLSQKEQSVGFDVTDGDGKPIAEATILFSGLEKVFKTDSQGKILEKVPEGEYSLSVFHPNFQTKTLSGVKISEGTPNLAVSLKPAQNELEDVVVLAPKIKGSLSALVEIRKQSSAVTDVLGAEQMARAGDSDAAASLRRVTGLTLVGGKYVYVRGLGERYSGVQMNSFSLPSPEPARRVVPLDLFPTSIMESIIVQKSYSPDLPGEFGGGIIQLKTRSLPEKFFLRSNVSFLYENVNNRLEHQGGSLDWLGMDDGTRKMPANVQAVLAQGKQLEVNTPGFNGGVSAQELSQLTQSFPSGTEFSRVDTPSMPGLSLTTGTGMKKGKVQIGTSGSVIYSQNTDQLSRTVRTFSIGAGGKLANDTQRLSEYSEIETRLGGSYEVGVEVAKKHRLIANTFLLRNTTKLTQIDQTTFVSDPSTQTYTADFTERQLWTRHLKGEHEVWKWGTTPLQLDWRWGWADARRDSPRRMELAYMLNGDGSKTLLDNQTGNQTIYSFLEDNSVEKALNLTLPIFINDREWVKVKVGLMDIDKQRDSDTNRFNFNTQKLTPEQKANSDTALSQENKTNGSISLNSSSTNTDSYQGVQTIQAQYALVEVNPLESLSFQAGLRREKSVQTVKTFLYQNPQNPSSESEISMTDVLPSYGVVWKPTASVRARFNYSETLSRPDFREMAISSFIDDETGNFIKGNENLKGTVIRNFDHRWEYYFTADEYASIGFFYKEFQNPIEVIFLPGVNRIQSFENAKAAKNYGIELEGRVGLRHFARPLRRWTVLSNVTYINSQIELNEENLGTQTSKERPLQGQSPYAINFQLQYDRPQWGLSATTLYNVVGKRITEVGTSKIPDTYEQPFGQLDFVGTKSINKTWTMSLRARNLLDPEVESTQGNEMVRSQRRGRTFSLVMGAVF